MLWSKPVATISAPKTKKVMTWRMALVFSANSTKPCGDVALRRAHRDPADEGRDQAVSEGDIGEPEGEEGEADRIDPLVARGQATPRQAVVVPAAEHPQGDPDQPADNRLPGQLRRFGAGLATRRREDEEEEDEGKRQAIVEARLEVERVAHRAGYKA